MAAEFKFDYKDLAMYGMKVAEMHKVTSDKTKKEFLRKEGSKLLRKTKGAIRSSGMDYRNHVKPEAFKDSKHYYQTVKRGKPYLYESAMAIRVYSYAPHAHLLEYGHKMIGHKPDKRSVGGATRAFKPFETGLEQMQQLFYSDTIKWYEEHYKELWN